MGPGRLAVGAVPGFGTLTGGLIGLLLGPGGARAGAIGRGSISFLFGKAVDVAVKDPGAPKI